MKGIVKIRKKPKSVPLSNDELKALKIFRKGYKKEVECACELGVDRMVLGRVLLVGSGSPYSINKIRKALSKFNETTNA